MGRLQISFAQSLSHIIQFLSIFERQVGRSTDVYIDQININLGYVFTLVNQLYVFSLLYYQFETLIKPLSGSFRGSFFFDDLILSVEAIQTFCRF